MKYNPIEFIKSLYNRSLYFLLSPPQDGGLEVKAEKPAISDEMRSRLREIVAQERVLLQYAAAARFAEFDMHYKQQPPPRSFSMLNR